MNNQVFETIGVKTRGTESGAQAESQGLASAAAEREIDVELADVSGGIPPRDGLS
jgi:hypothetical protein